MKQLSSLINITIGERVCLIGCGGKTSLMFYLARELKQNRILLTTTTHIMKPQDDSFDFYHDGSKIPQDILPGIHVLGESDRQPGKLKALDLDKLPDWISRFDISLVEGDGSCGLPLKGWACHEPVIPPWITTTIGVVTLWPIGLPVSEKTVFRMPLFRQLTGARIGQSITIQHIADMISLPDGLFRKATGKRILFINQVESEETLGLTRELSELLTDMNLDMIIAGSVKLSTGEIIWSGVRQE